MIKALIFDFNGVLEQYGKLDQELISFIDELEDIELAIMTRLDLINLRLALFQAPKGLFTNLFTPDTMSPLKPHAEAFIEVAKQIGCEPQECLFVDDSQVNVDGAHAAGMQAFLFRDTESGIARITALLEDAKN